MDRRAVQRSKQTSLAFRLPLDPARLLRARQRIRDYLDQQGVPVDAIDAVVLAVEEAMTNAVRHSDAKGDLEVRLGFDGHDLHAAVEDKGKGFDVDSFDCDRLPDLMSPGGRGLYLISQLMDDIALVCDGGLEVRMLKRQALPVPAAVASLETGLADAHHLDGTGYREQRLKLIVDELGEGYAALDWEYRFIYANEAALRLYRRSSGEVLRRRVWELFPHIAEHPLGRGIRAAVELGNSTIVDFESQELGRWIECRIYPTGSGASLYLRDIDERKRKELERDQLFEAQRASEERFRTLFANMTEGVALHEIVYDRGEAVDYRIVEVNPAFETQTGLRCEDLRGRLASEVYGTGEAPYLDEYVAVAEKGARVAFETYFAPLERHFNVSAVPVMPGQFATIFEDVSERRRTEEALRRSETRYGELVQNANSAILRWSRDGRITFINEYAQELFGWNADQAIGMPVTTLLPEKDSMGLDLRGPAEDILAHPEAFASTINENICRDGRRLWMTWANRAVRDERGEVVEILAVGNEATDAKRDPDTLRGSQE